MSAKPTSAARAIIESIEPRVDMSAMEQKAVLVTGATGLIGLNLIAALMKGPARWIMGASRSGLPDWATAWKDDSRFIDLRFDKAPKSPPPVPDFVIHAAGYAQPAKFMSEALATLRINTTKTDALIGQMAAGGRFLFVSSSEVYSGAPAPHQDTDIGSTTPQHPRAAYIEGKRCGEAIVNAWRQAGVTAMSARVCLAYGPGVKFDDQRAMSEIIRQAMQDKKIRLRDRGDAVRAYLYVTDAVDMLLTILLHGKEALYNVGAPRATTIRTLAEFVGIVEGADVILPKLETGITNDAPSEAHLDIRPYLAEFGQRQFITLDEGLRRTINWFKEINR